MLLVSAGIACAPGRVVEDAVDAKAIAPVVDVPAPVPVAEAPEPVRPRRVPLRFLPPWRPQWRVELTIPTKAHFGALEQGVLVYVRSHEPFGSVPHRVTDGRLTPVPAMGLVTLDQHDSQWLEFYGRWPDALWRIVPRDDPRRLAISQWTDGGWRPSAPFPGECDLDLVGHSFDQSLLLAPRECAGADESAVQLYALGAGGWSRVGPPLSSVPQLALATAEALYVAGFFDTRPAGGSELSQTIRRYACAAPYDCAPEVLSLADLPGVLTWLDHTWARQWQGLAHRRGVSIAAQHRTEVLEAYLLTDESGEWRAIPAPGRITALLAVEDARIVVTRAPADDAELTNGGWPESKPTQRGDTLWLLGKGETDWRPIRLPEQPLASTTLQVAVEGSTLWLAASSYPPSVTLFSAPMDHE